MNDLYTFREFEERDLPQITHLTETVLGEKRGNSYHEWKYMKNPAGKAFSVVALSGNELVGHLGLIPVKCSAMGKTLIFAQEVDVGLYENCRRFDVILRMADFMKTSLCRKRVSFSFSIPNETSFLLTQTFGVRKTIAPVPLLTKPLNVKGLLDSRFRLNSLNSLVARAASPLLKLIYPEKGGVPNGMRLKKIRLFDKRFDALWDRVKDDYPIMVERTSAYLNWRYADAPHKKYEIVCLEDTVSKQLAAYAVLGQEWHGHLIGQIYNILTPRKGNAEICRCLLRAAIEHFRKIGADSIRCWMFPHTHIYPELRKLGFWPRPRENINLVFEAFDKSSGAPDSQVVQNSLNWFFTRGDSDAEIF
jgi:hypothetical protein